MIYYMLKFIDKNLKSIVSCLLFFCCLSLSSPMAVWSSSPAEKRDALSPPNPISRSKPFCPPILRGVKLLPENPFFLDFIMDIGEDENPDTLHSTTSRLIKYFLIGLTIPEDQMWVNLSPYEADRIIPKMLGQTAMGRDLLAQDYLLKQITASLLHPEQKLGRAFWDRVYQKINFDFESADLPIKTFNKIWILPEKARIYEHDNSVFVIDSKLKVMMEEDYLALNEDMIARAKTSRSPPEQRILELNDISSSVVREILLPAIEEEVNYGQHFAPLRQIYHSLILAVWFKDSLEKSVLGQSYADQNKIEGVTIEDKNIKKKIYDQYLKTFRSGIYNFIREEYDPIAQEISTRHYLSGGILPATRAALENVSDLAIVNSQKNLPYLREVNIALKRHDQAMTIKAKEKNTLLREKINSQLWDLAQGGENHGSWRTMIEGLRESSYIDIINNVLAEFLSKGLNFSHFNPHEVIIPANAKKYNLHLGVRQEDGAFIGAVNGVTEDGDPYVLVPINFLGRSDAGAVSIEGQAIMLHELVEVELDRLLSMEQPREDILFAVLSEIFNVSADSAADKELLRKLVREHYGIDIEAEFYGEENPISHVLAHIVSQTYLEKKSKAADDKETAMIFVKIKKSLARINSTKPGIHGAYSWASERTSPRKSGKREYSSHLFTSEPDNTAAIVERFGLSAQQSETLKDLFRERLDNAPILPYIDQIPEFSDKKPQSRFTDQRPSDVHPDKLREKIFSAHDHYIKKLGNLYGRAAIEENYRVVWHVKRVTKTIAPEFFKRWHSQESVRSLYHLTDHHAEALYTWLAIHDIAKLHPLLLPIFQSKRKFTDNSIERELLALHEREELLFGMLEAQDIHIPDEVIKIFEAIQYLEHYKLMSTGVPGIESEKMPQLEYIVLAFLAHLIDITDGYLDAHRGYHSRWWSSKHLPSTTEILQEINKLSKAVSILENKTLDKFVGQAVILFAELMDDPQYDFRSLVEVTFPEHVADIHIQGVGDKGFSLDTHITLIVSLAIEYDLYALNIPVDQWWEIIYKRIKHLVGEDEELRLKEAGQRALYEAQGPEGRSLHFQRHQPISPDNLLAYMLLIFSSSEYPQRATTDRTHHLQNLLESFGLYLLKEEDRHNFVLKFIMHADLREEEAYKLWKAVNFHFRMARKASQKNAATSAAIIQSEETPLGGIDFNPEHVAFERLGQTSDAAMQVGGGGDIGQRIPFSGLSPIIFNISPMPTMYDLHHFLGVQTIPDELLPYPTISPLR